MALVNSKGTVFQIEISTVLTAVGALTEVSSSGAEVLTWDSTTIDGAVGKTYNPNGYSEPGSKSISGFYDPVLANHTVIRDLLTTPVQTGCAIVYADAATTTEAFEIAGASWDVTAGMDDGLRFSSTLKQTGLSTYA